MLGQLWLNVGCGDRKGPRPWINCDLYPGVEPDVIFDCVEPWPFEAATADRIYMGQLVEHLDYPHAVTAALEEAVKVLRPGGLLAVVCPDRISVAEKRCAQWIWDNLRRGECRWPGDEHRWFPDRHTVFGLVRQVVPNAVPTNVTNLHDGWPPGNRDPWDCCIIGRLAV